IRLDDINTTLIGVFEVEEEERLVLLDRADQEKAALPPGEERIVGNRRATQRRVSRDVVIAEVEVCGAMKTVAPAARHHIDRAEGGNPGREVEIGARKLELLHHFLREVLPRSAFDRIADIA